MENLDWLNREEYPFSPNYLLLAAGRLHYVDVGQGETLIMVHGTPTWSFLYRNLIKSLAAEYRCIVPDLLGFGLSDKPKKWEYTPAAHAENLAAFITSLQLKDITLIVHDYGGPIGLHYAINNPRNVKRIVVMNSWLWPLDKDKTIKQSSQFFGSLMGKVLYQYFNFSTQVLLPRGFYNNKCLTQAIKQHYLKPFNKPSDCLGTWYFAKELLQSKDWYGELWNKHAILASKPMLILWGKHDTFFGHPYLFKWHMHFLQAKIVELDAGHFVMEEKPVEVLEEIIKFLKMNKD